VLVKKLLPIFLLSIYLVSVTELHELFKLPQLVEHFMEHKSEDSKTSLLNFLVMHYANTDDGDGDKSKDMKLPFKSNHDCANFANTGFISFNTFSLAIKSTPIKSKIYKTNATDFISSAYLSSIWQPPKSC
jgi:hypothetical protein